MEIEKTQKNPDKYICEICDFKSSHKNDYSKHLLTPKHKKMSFGHEMEINGNKKTQKNPDKYCCEKCNKVYSTNSGLWKHKKICKFDKKNEEDKVSNSDDKNNKLIEYLMKENKEIKEMILEIVKNGSRPFDFFK